MYLYSNFLNFLQENSLLADKGCIIILEWREGNNVFKVIHVSLFGIPDQCSNNRSTTVGFLGHANRRLVLGSTEDKEKEKNNFVKQSHYIYDVN